LLDNKINEMAGYRSAPHDTTWEYKEREGGSIGKGRRGKGGQGRKGGIKSVDQIN